MATEKSRGNLSGAIELLRKYLDVYMLDKVAWEELGELYLQVKQHSPLFLCEVTCEAAIAFILPALTRPLGLTYAITIALPLSFGHTCPDLLFSLCTAALPPHSAVSLLLYAECDTVRAKDP